jgi:hypothetical protein
VFMPGLALFRDFCWLLWRFLYWLFLKGDGW